MLDDKSLNFLKKSLTPTITFPIRKAQPQVHLKFPLVILQLIPPILIIPQPPTPNNSRTQNSPFGINDQIIQHL
jgi:hypothetical protein